VPIATIGRASAVQTTVLLARGEGVLIDSLRRSPGDCGRGRVGGGRIGTVSGNVDVA
jgi:hypothetical protein